MRIEKISETQVKFILMQADLEERSIKLSEFTYGSDKIQQLFQEMMSLAQSEYEFAADTAPLMVEAMRVGLDSIVVIVTKITEAREFEKKLNLIPQARTEARFKRKPFIETENHPGGDSISVFSFDTLDNATEAAARLNGRFEGVSRVYKCDGRYFLLLQNETEDDRNTTDLEAVLYEYGQKHISNEFSKQYLTEHGEAIIADNAVEKLGAFI